MFNPGDSASPYPESYLTLTLAAAGNDVALTLEHLPVLERFVKLNAMGWHTYLDMVDAAGARRDGRNRAIPTWRRTPGTTASISPIRRRDRQSDGGASSADCHQEMGVAVATGLERSSCQASAKTLTMRRPCLVTLAEAMTSTGRAERR